MTNIEEKGYAEKVKFARYNKYSDAVKKSNIAEFKSIIQMGQTAIESILFYLLMQVPLLPFLALFTNNMKIFLVANQKLLDVGMTILDALLFFLLVWYFYVCHIFHNAIIRIIMKSIFQK